MGEGALVLRQAQDERIGVRWEGRPQGSPLRMTCGDKRGEGECAEGAVEGALGGKGAVDEVDFFNGPLQFTGIGIVLDGGAYDVSLGLGQSSTDASEGEVGSEGAAVGFEAEGTAVFFDGGLEAVEG